MNNNNNNNNTPSKDHGKKVGSSTFIGAFTICGYIAKVVDKYEDSPFKAIILYFANKPPKNNPDKEMPLIVITINVRKDHNVVPYLQKGSYVTFSMRSNPRISPINDGACFITGYCSDLKLGPHVNSDFKLLKEMKINKEQTQSMDEFVNDDADSVF